MCIAEFFYFIPTFSTTKNCCQSDINYSFKAMFLEVIVTRILNIVQYNGDFHIVFYWKGNTFLWNITDYERESNASALELIRNPSKAPKLSADYT